MLCTRTWRRLASSRFCWPCPKGLNLIEKTWKNSGNLSGNTKKTSKKTSKELETAENEAKDVVIFQVGTLARDLSNHEIKLSLTSIDWWIDRAMRTFLHKLVWPVANHGLRGYGLEWLYINHVLKTRTSDLRPRRGFQITKSQGVLNMSLQNFADPDQQSFAADVLLPFALHFWHVLK